MILLVVDTQKAIINEKLYQFEMFRENVKELINTARFNNVEVVFVRHDDGAGCELTKGEDGFEIYEDFKPAENELVFDKKVNSAFRDSGLLEYVKNKNENTIIIVGLQTDYCIDATIKAGFEHGLKMIVPAYTNTTFDNEYMTAEQTYSYFNEFIWDKRYAEYMAFEAVVDLIRGQNNCHL